MSRRTEEKVFNYEDDSGENVALTLTFTQLKPSQALKVKVRILKLLGGPAGKLFQAFKKIEGAKSAMDLDFDVSSLGPMFESLADRLDEDDVIETLNLLFKSVIAGSKPLHVDHDMFIGNTGDILVAAQTAAEVNFGDFLGGLSAFGKKLKATGSMILGKRPSTGISGESSQED